MTSSRVLAVDLGATSVRVASVDLDAPDPEVDVLHRWHHAPVTAADGSLRWDWPGIVEHVELGLEIGLGSGPVASIGVDGWGVDYGLVNATGELVDLPFAYRDSRTNGWEVTAMEIGHDTLYEITGVQLMGINTIFQLAADTTERLTSARHILLLPDLLVNHLTGWVGCELSNMSTTGLMDAETRSWADELIDAIGLRRSLFPDPAHAGDRVGEWRGTPVHLVGSHDTASAFLGAPSSGPSSIFISTGSWVIIGIERDDPDTSPAARAANFSNEAGALGGIRFLKNVVGFWILEQCRKAWGSPPIEDLITEAGHVEQGVSTFDASDHKFISPADMLTEVLDASGLNADSSRAVIARSIIESIVDGICSVVDEISSVTGTEPGNLALVGGGVRNPLLAGILEEKSGFEVVVGSAEAAALGNAVIQGMALGRFGDLDEARQWLRTRPVTSGDQR
ncbi:MAG TPA: FGGY-family carbohydrate kinase [Acidimicrobiia bacterium]